MGKASSSKKVARASRVGGGGKVSQQRNLTFPVTIAVILVLGLSLVIFASRNNKATADDTQPIANVDHWHTAYGIYACDAFLDPLQVQTDPEGIHTHADGVIHIHPYVSSSAGKNATLQVFADATGLKLSDTKIDVPGVGSFKNGDDCNGKPATWKVAVWQTEEATTPRIVTSDFGKIHFDNDRMLMTLAFVPDGTDIPKPPSVAQLDKLTDVPQPAGSATLGNITDTTAVATPGASAPATTAAPSSSTPPAAATTGS
ncbi:MAG TPA: hypothetical protein VMK16_13625 [Acidimicrobiales bacterium]|nr:hypothetical protein [Acidimicrobiales bacterium]